MLIAAGLLSALPGCFAQLPCASGDPSCDARGILALLGKSSYNSFVVGTSDGQIAYSTDEGQSWNLASLGASNYNVSGFAVAQGTVFAFGDDSGGNGFYFTSTDLQTWLGPITVSGNPLSFGSSDGSSVFVLSAATSNYFQLTYDAGPIPLGVIDTSTGGINLFKFYDGHWFVGDTPPADPPLRYGTGLSSLAPPSGGVTDPVNDVVKIGTNYLLTGAPGGAVDAFVSVGSLDSWMTISPGASFTAICGNGRIALAASTAGNVYSTTDAQSLGSSTNTGLVAPLTDIACYGETFIVIPNATGNWALSSTAGASWNLITNPVGTGTPRAIEYIP
ncbi:MAG: hypothetical protein KDK37_08965 [Leptospiraceae bacterium]|nr:hypothetical protein [Leptospiraceae bacterium]